MILMITVLGFLTLIAVGTYYWAPLPLLSYVQERNRSISGKVTEIKHLPGLLVEVKLTTEAEIDPRLQQGPERFISCHRGSYVHVRPWDDLPEVGTLVTAQTHARLYVLRSRSLNWVDSWKSIKKVPFGRYVSLEPSHELAA